MGSLHWSAALIFVASSCASAKPNAKDVPANQGAVTLNFDWPVVVGSVKRTHTERENNATAETTSVVYTVTTRDTSQGIEVTYSDPRDLEMTDAPPGTLAAVQQMFETVPTLTLAEGKVVAVGNTEALRNLMDEIAPIPPDATAATRAMLEKARTDEFMLDAARGEWNAITTIWHGGTIQLGRPIRGETHVQVMMMPQPVKTNIELSLLEHLPCPGAPSRACVRLRYVSRPDSESMAAGLAWIAEDARQKGKSMVIENIDRVLTAEVITEPDTLLPYMFEQTEETTVRVREGDRVDTAQRFKQRIEEYSWQH